MMLGTQTQEVIQMDTFIGGVIITGVCLFYGGIALIPIACVYSLFKD